MDMTDKDMEKDVTEFQTLQQQLQIVMMQRQQMAMQSTELQKAMDEVKGASGTLYRFVGTVIVPKSKDALIAELQTEKESLDFRQSTMLKQEETLKVRFNALRKKLETGLKKQEN